MANNHKVNSSSEFEVNNGVAEHSNPEVEDKDHKY